MQLHGFVCIDIDLKGISVVYGLRGRAACGNLWQPVATCGKLWRPVAPTNRKLSPLYNTLLSSGLDGWMAGWQDGGWLAGSLAGWVGGWLA